MGGLTSKGGHPVSLFVNVLSGSVYEKLAYEDFAGMAFHEIDSLEQIDPALDVIESQGADFVKLLMLYAEDYEQPNFVQGRGLNPISVRPIVESAHRRGLPVTAHVQSAYDLGIAVAAGVDEIAHLPGYYWREENERYRHRITDAEAVATAAASVAVVTSTLFPQGYADDERKALIRETQVANLRKLLDAGVELRIGSDIYDRKQTGEDRYATRSELLNLVELGVMDASMALATWIATGRAIFPERKIACFDPGCEASFLIFDHDPREDITELLRIRNAVKQGVEVGRKIKAKIDLAS
jgi:imidazolonepropionase-like amidohydrolase